MTRKIRGKQNPLEDIKLRDFKKHFYKWAKDKLESGGIRNQDDLRSLILKKTKNKFEEAIRKNGRIPEKIHVEFGKAVLTLYDIKHSGKGIDEVDLEELKNDLLLDAIEELEGTGVLEYAIKKLKIPVQTHNTDKKETKTTRQGKAKNIKVPTEDKMKITKANEPVYVSPKEANNLRTWKNMILKELPRSANLLNNLASLNEAELLENLRTELAENEKHWKTIWDEIVSDKEKRKILVKYARENSFITLSKLKETIRKNPETIDLHGLKKYDPKLKIEVSKLIDLAKSMQTLKSLERDTKSAIGEIKRLAKLHNKALKQSYSTRKRVVKWFLSRKVKRRR